MGTITVSLEKLRMGIVGIGYYAITRHVPDLLSTNRADIVAISRRNVEALADAKRVLGVEHAYTDWQELIDSCELDAVVVSTAHHVHASPTIAALKRGLHVLVEKPMALRSVDAWNMVATADEAERFLAVGYTVRTKGCWRVAKQALQECVIGPVRHINLVFSYDFRPILEADRLPLQILEGMKAGGMPGSFFVNGELEGYWRRNPAEMGGGAFADHGSHMVDLALWLGGASPVRVTAFTETAGMSVDRVVQVQARLNNDVLLSLSGVDAVPGGPRFHLVVHGDLGVMTAEQKGWGTPEIWVDTGERKALNVEIPNGTVAAEFIRGVTGEDADLASGREGAYAVALTEAAYLAAREQRMVPIEIPEQYRESDA